LKDSGQKSQIFHGHPHLLSTEGGSVGILSRHLEWWSDRAVVVHSVMLTQWETGRWSCRYILLQLADSVRQKGCQTINFL